MTLLLMDGFDLGDVGTRYSGTVSGTIGPTNTISRFGYGQYLIIKDGGTFKASFTPSATVIVGVSAAIADVGGGGPNGKVYLWADGGTVNHLQVGWDGAGHLQVWRGDGTLLATSTDIIMPLVAYHWRHWEIKAVISDTVGSVEIRIDGASTPVINISGVDTRNGGTSTNIDAVSINNPNGAYSAWDDFYVLNTLGSVNNNFLGDVRVYALSPNGNGNYSQFVGSDADSVNNYLLVNEKTPNTANYVGSPTTGNRDSYVMEDLPATVLTVYGTQEVVMAAKSDAGVVSMKQSMRVAATDYDTAATTLASSYMDLTNVRETNPNTAAAWTAAGVNGVEVGVVVG